MVITKEQLVGAPKKIGSLDGEEVLENSTKGGLHFVFAVRKNGKTETLGMGNHPAVARFIAQKEHPTLQVTSLNKSEDLPKWVCEKEAPQYVALTARMRELEK